MDAMLTDSEIRRALRGATSETTLNDHTAGRGAGSLRLRIRPNSTGASGVWLVFWKQGGERATKPLGRYPDMTAADARRVYREEVAPILLAGKDPRVKVTSADKARSYIHSAYAWALKAANDYTVTDRLDWGVRANPVAVVAKDRDATTARERNLSADELRTLWHAATPGQNGFTLETAGAIRLLIGTGQRVQEVLRLDGAELDLDAGVWTMPRGKSKMRTRRHVVPLPRQVLPIARQLVEAHGTGPLFPSRKGAKRERMAHASVKQAIDRWLAGVGVTAAQFQTRDLRRTWKSRMGEAGVSKEMRDLIQQHAKGDTSSRVYDIADYLPQMRAAMDRWEAWLDQVLG